MKLNISVLVGSSCSQSFRDVWLYPIISIERERLISPANRPEASYFQGIRKYTNLVYYSMSVAPISGVVGPRLSLGNLGKWGNDLSPKPKPGDFEAVSGNSSFFVAVSSVV